MKEFISDMFDLYKKDGINIEEYEENKNKETYDEEDGFSDNEEDGEEENDYESKNSDIGEFIKNSNSPKENTKSGITLQEIKDFKEQHSKVSNWYDFMSMIGITDQDLKKYGKTDKK
jgi:hypothetical protein